MNAIPAVTGPQGRTRICAKDGCDLEVKPGDGRRKYCPEHTTSRAKTKLSNGSGNSYQTRMQELREARSECYSIDPNTGEALGEWMKPPRDPTTDVTKIGPYRVLTTSD